MQTFDAVSSGIEFKRIICGLDFTFALTKNKAEKETPSNLWSWGNP